MSQPMQEKQLQQLLSQQLLSRRQLSERWQVSKETVKRKEKAGLLPVLKLAGCRDARYRLADILRLETEAEVHG
jgi:DNA-binding XRE family transcriptional regulator